MYCPRCGRQPIAESLRFCSYCGFKLGVVKAILAEEDEVSPDSSTVQVLTKQLRQRDINIGVILMFAGTLLATFLAATGGLRLGREGGALALLISFASIILLSRPVIRTIYKLLSWEELPAHSFSLHQRGMLFGSLMMFTSTIVIAISAMLMFGRMMTPQLLFALIATFIVLLVFSKQAIRAIRYLVASDVVVPENDVAPDPGTVNVAGSSPALTAAQNLPVSLFTAERVTTAEILSPASVTEQTTNLLENK